MRKEKISWKLSIIKTQVHFWGYTLCVCVSVCVFLYVCFCACVCVCNLQLYFLRNCLMSLLSAVHLFCKCKIYVLQNFPLRKKKAKCKLILSKEYRRIYLRIMPALTRKKADDNTTGTWSIFCSPRNKSVLHGFSEIKAKLYLCNMIYTKA